MDGGRPVGAAHAPWPGAERTVLVSSLESGAT